MRRTDIHVRDWQTGGTVTITHDSNRTLRWAADLILACHRARATEKM